MPFADSPNPVFPDCFQTIHNLPEQGLKFPEFPRSFLQCGQNPQVFRLNGGKWFPVSLLRFCPFLAFPVPE
jgi:hypothetical protein